MELKELNSKEMGARIMARRKMLNMSRDDLGAAISVTGKTIANIEYGDKGMSIRNLYKLKQVLGVSIDYLMEGDEAYKDQEEKRRMINQNILGSLSVCSVEQLGCMEQIARIYVEGVVNKE